MEPLAQSVVTPEEYLALERAAGHKSEYFNGQIFALAGAGRQHNQITVNIARELSTQFRGRECAIYVNDMRVKVSATGLYTYPDAAAVCGEPLFEDDHLDTLLNPTVIMEVLSDSTEAYDRGGKFALYRRLPSLQEYVIIAQDQARVEHFVRQGTQWVMSEVDDLTGTISLDSIDCRLPLQEIYDKVEFPAAAPARR
ncbi:MAG: Uma2 family endonuclease [Deltaproteobacteria bacterium]|nr:Uma2 family endonuclease [Deltaproteobacteria bacterium]